MSALRVLIVDDEAPARSRLRRLLDGFVEDGRIEAPVEAADGVEALERLAEAERPFDLAFLDVRMPEVDGFDVVERVAAERRPDVVFTTAYDEYALRAFRANATDYLLKPIDAERLEEALARVEDRRGDSEERDERLAALLDTLDEQAAAPPPDGDTGPPIERFTVQGVDRLVVVSAGDVIAAEVSDGITNLYVRQEGREGGAGIGRHLVGFTLDALEARLDPARFMRVHRSALVNLTCVREMVPWFSGRYKIVLTGGHEVTASRSRSRELRDRLSL
ncbi:LytTR family DNA-binding domain-containing protein [Rubrivirga sp. S365]|uniref:LytTR family DNA-binding domain-containing protein n=1 Tax=Rubrivirga litoralis TaxID=3075598 RepID=A0ABU3BTG2_9BACT|nr:MULTISPECIES: LytTR family DNA-binding domain-containing protein [unclassified Rubrivirga]MDT0632574.1 LytTR family DNA-binding domain-containing protein [Rubrivirga sp. F394]MDT7856736.1 LytTR family DNA-binding domain-containing protein [Rubrivirga sp. S365]